MKNKILYFLLFMCMASLKTNAQDILLPSSHYKFKVVEKVCEKIAKVREYDRIVPELKMYAKQSKTQVIAQFVAVNGHQIIYVDEKLYDLCAKFGADSLNALACILGHELAHYTQNHQYKDGFFAGLLPSSFGIPKGIRKSAKDQKMKLEIEADYYGLLQGYLAGYSTYQLLPKVLKKIYEEYKLSEQLDGYPTKNERISAAEKTAQEIETLVPIFNAGKFLYLSKNYEDAGACFQYISNTFTDRDIANNIGVSALAQAMMLMEKENVYFAYPCELDASGRLLSSTARSTLSNDGKKDKKQQIKDLLKRAETHLEQVLKLDKAYTAAHINLACKYSLEGNHAFAVGYINKLEKILAEDPSIKGGLPANAHLIRGIALAKNNQLDEAKSDFETAAKKKAFMADYNLALYNKINQSFLEKLFDITDLKEWITDFIAENQKDNSKFIPAKGETIDNTPIQTLLKEKFETNTSIQLAGRAINIACVNTEVADKIKIRLFDKNVYLLATKPNYMGKTSQGMAIGTTKNQLIAAYGNPSYVQAGSNAEFYFYEKVKMIVEVSEGKVKNWMLYYIEVRN
ncbi:MAG: hypothetical protein EAZ08_05820 [Cytophagales bacterium]|nr:MAG: hypothetical protein EAZ08_05820 [Cytophagales bacterium]